MRWCSRGGKGEGGDAAAAGSGGGAAGNNWGGGGRGCRLHTRSHPIHIPSTPYIRAALTPCTLYSHHVQVQYVERAHQDAGGFAALLAAHGPPSPQGGGAGGPGGVSGPEDSEMPETGEEDDEEEGEDGVQSAASSTVREGGRRGKMVPEVVGKSQPHKQSSSPHIFAGRGMPALMSLPLGSLASQSGPDL